MWQDVGLYCGVAAIAYGVLASIWHWTNLWFEKQNRPTLKSRPALPLIFLLSAAAIGEYFWFSHTVSNRDDELRTKNTTIENLQTELGAKDELIKNWRVERIELGNELAKAQKELSDAKSQQTIIPPIRVSLPLIPQIPTRDTILTNAEQEVILTPSDHLTP
jgi:hypothetical protein